MPFVVVSSNIAGSAFSEDFVRKLCSCAAATLGKPEEVSEGPPGPVRPPPTLRLSPNVTFEPADDQRGAPT